MSERLGGHVIVVTGASGIAAAGALRYAAEGARVFVISRTESPLLSLVSQITEAGGTAAYATADLTNEEMTEHAFAECERTYGRIDGLFAVAGGSGRSLGDGPLHTTSLDAWSGTHVLNGHPAFLAARETLRRVLDRDRGCSIVLVSSVLASSPVPSRFATHAYAAIKGAEIALTTSMAAYYAPYGIRVNSVAPGLVDTPMAKRAASDPDIVAFARRKQPLAGGFLAADDVANAGLFLLSDDARAVTGQTLIVDGGWSVTGDVR